MPLLSIRVLGPLQVSVNGKSVSGFASDKVRALLVYLALMPDHPHRRETLAGLLWPEYPEQSARNSLRNALANLRKALGEHARSGDGAFSPPFLHATRQTIQFNGQSDYWLDADAFESLVASVPAVSERMEETVRLVRGTFLEGFSLADAAPFEEWLLLRREHFSRKVVEALASLAAIYEEGCAYESALGHARRWVELEPWQEEGWRQLMRLLVRSGRHGEALAQYERLCSSLREELGAEPSAETKALWEAILSGELAPKPALAQGPPVPVWNLPASTTPFFGRSDELAALESKLTEPDTRLVTLTGLGGCGKTRLALELGSRLAERDRLALADQSPPTLPNGIAFVPLAAVETVEGLAPALADALRLRLEGGQEQLLEYLRPRQLLLILDNLEQLPSVAGFLAEILRIAPGVKILATSRERLQVQGEHVITLGGLPYPEQDLQPSTPAAADPETCLAVYPAYQLLVDGIQRICSDFTPSPADLPAMLGICRLVDGLPLALVLAASWSDALSVNDIQVEARRSLDFWQADWPDLPERQRSIRAVFDVSWRRLGPAERASFSSLTVFRGGFTREGAGRVLDGEEATLSTLVALVRKCLVRYDRAKDRYGIHELLRQYGAEKLAQDPTRETGARNLHSAYFLDVLKRLEAEQSGSQEVVLIEAEAESENIRAAWYWAVERVHVEHLDRAMEGLEHFFWHSGRNREAEAAFEAAAAAAAAAGRAATDSAIKARCLRVAARALAWQIDFCQGMGHGDEARRLLQRCQTTLNDPALTGWDTRLERAMLCRSAGLNLRATDREQARRRFEESYSLFRELDHRRGMAWALNDWGIMSTDLGAYQDAKRRVAEALAIWRGLDDQPGIAGSLSFLAYIARVEGRFKEAERLAREGHTTALQAGTRRQAAKGQLILGQALESLGRFSEAHSVSQQSLDLLNQLGHRYQVGEAHTELGYFSLHRGDYEEARDQAYTGLALARKHGPPHQVGLNLLLLGCLDLAAGSPSRAHRHLRESMAVYRELKRGSDLSRGFAVLTFVTLAIGDAQEARQHLCCAFQLGIESEAVPPFLWALPAMALLLAGRGEHERAVELYALASRYPFVARSSWFVDVVGQQIYTVAAALPAERVAILQEHGQARDLEETAAELLTELRT